MSQLMKNKVGQQVKPYAKGGVISKKATGKKDIPDTDKSTPGKSNTTDTQKDARKSQKTEMLKKGGRC